MSSPQIIISGVVVQGHQVASGKGAGSPYPAGTIEMQRPFFKHLGLDISECFDGTLNVQLPVCAFRILKPTFCFENLHWAKGFNQETFSLVKCQIKFQVQQFDAWVYYPHPETKTQHFQQQNIIEILAPPIVNIHYGDNVTLMFNSDTIEFDES
ncbi:hypothetical protein [Alteromonas sp. M12]|uniref:hypothetical protein n=1 Tax=Alteromonas sp. M12 TaxID=3135644 RepID=UPI00319EB6AE